MRLKVHRFIECVAAAVPLLTGDSAHAQQETAKEILARAQQTVSAAESEWDCDIRLIGDPEAEPLSGRWLVNFMATGEECDGASATMANQQIHADVQFMRRPNIDQATVIARQIVRTVSLSFDCQILMTGSPRLQESSGRWLVEFTSTGRNCTDAREVLRRRGNDLGVWFLG